MQRIVIKDSFVPANRHWAQRCRFKTSLSDPNCVASFKKHKLMANSCTRHPNVTSLWQLLCSESQIRRILRPIELIYKKIEQRNAKLTKNIWHFLSLSYSAVKLLLPSAFLDSSNECWFCPPAAGCVNNLLFTKEFTFCRWSFVSVVFLGSECPHVSPLKIKQKAWWTTILLYQTIPRTRDVSIKYQRL